MTLICVSSEYRTGGLSSGFYHAGLSSGLTQIALSSREQRYHCYYSIALSEVGMPKVARSPERLSYVKWFMETDFLDVSESLI